MSQVICIWFVLCAFDYIVLFISDSYDLFTHIIQSYSIGTEAILDCLSASEVILC